MTPPTDPPPPPHDDLMGRLRASVERTRPPLRFDPRSPAAGGWEPGDAGAQIDDESIARVAAGVAGRAEPDPKPMVAAATSRRVLAERMLPLTPELDPVDPGAVVDATGVYWESPADALRGGVLGLCGCGSVDDIAADLRTLLLAHAPAGAPLTELPVLAGGGTGGVRYQEVLLHLLTDAELLEHGTTVWGSWRTGLGDRWAEELR